MFTRARARDVGRGLLVRGYIKRNTQCPIVFEFVNRKEISRILACGKMNNNDMNNMNRNNVMECTFYL